MMILKYQKWEFELDDEWFSFFKDRKLYHNTSRGVTRLRDVESNRFIHSIILGYEGRIKFKDGNNFNLRKENLLEYVKAPDYNKKYYNENKERLCERSMEWDRNNKDRRNETRRNWVRNNPQKNSLNLKQRGTRPRFKYKCLKNSAKTRGYEMTISYEKYLDILSKGCYYTGEDLLSSSYTGHCLDRIDNSKGYTEDNVLPCTGWVNKLRGNFLTVEETKVAVDAILNFRKTTATTTAI